MGYGFLIFDSKENAEKALIELSGKLMPKTNNKTFKLNYATFNDRKNENEHSIYVCYLDHNIDSEQLISFFKSKYKSVTGGKVIIDPSTKLSKGYGFVTFSDKDEKERAIKEMNGKILNNKAIKTGNACYKKNEGNKKKLNNFLQNQQLLFSKQCQQMINNPYLMANNYFANILNLNPFLQLQMMQFDENINIDEDSTEGN